MHVAWHVIDSDDGLHAWYTISSAFCFDEAHTPETEPVPAGTHPAPAQFRITYEQLYCSPVYVTGGVGPGSGFDAVG